MLPLRCLAWVPTTRLRVTPESSCSLPAPLPSPPPVPLYLDGPTILLLAE